MIGFTPDELIQLERNMEEHRPPLPTESDQFDAPRVSAMRVAKAEQGIVFNFGFEGGRSLMMAFNCVTATELVGVIDLASRICGWRKRVLLSSPGDYLEYPAPDLESAFQITSLSAATLPGGLLANFYVPVCGKAGATMMFYFPRQAALEVMNCIIDAGEVGKWWESDLLKLTAKYPSETRVVSHSVERT